MSVSKELRFKDVDGKETTIEFAVNAKNIQESNFTEAKVRENLKSGESVVKMLGKLAKWFTDLSKLAWSGKWADVGDKPGIGDLEGTLGVEKGGTGATSASGARTKLGIGAAATYPIADNDTTNNANYVPTARIVYEHGKEIDALSRDLGGLVFAQDADGNWGYKAGGADPVIPFKSSKVAMGGFKFLGNNGNPNGATVDVGFKPDFIMYGVLGGSDMTKAFYNGGSRNDRTLALWWSELQREFIWDSASDNPPMCIRRSFPTGPSTGNRLALQEVTDTGFKVYGGYGSGAAFYVCIKLE